MKEEDHPKTSFLHWLDERFPVTHFVNAHMRRYYAPKNLNFWYIFGVFSLVVFVNQLVTGIWMAMYYTPTANDAFTSVESIMRNVQYGWLLRYLHSTGASAFFVVMYLHMYRGIIYGSYRKPRELVWILGMFLFVLLIAEAFTGYVLPWGQMSYWATQVITNIFTAIPLIGSSLAELIRGDFNVSGVTLHRFFSFHVILIPLLIIAFVGLHLIALHAVGSNNPKGVEIKDKKDSRGIPVDGIPFHPYYTVKDWFAVVVFLIVFLSVVFFNPMMHGYFLEKDNFIPANPLITPAHIAPVWYLTPFYAILRAVPDKLLGVITMAAAIAMLWILPWLDRSPVKSLKYKGPYSKIALMLFVVSFIALGYLGAMPPATIRTLLAQFFTILYFAFFILMPYYTRKEAYRIPPERL